MVRALCTIRLLILRPSMKYRPKRVGGAFSNLQRKPISKSIARKASLALGVDYDAIVNIHENRNELESALGKLNSEQVLDLLIEVDLMLQQADNTAQRYIESAKATNERLKAAFAENQLVLTNLSKLVHGHDAVPKDESMEKLVPAVQGLIEELERQNEELVRARIEAEEAAK